MKYLILGNGYLGSRFKEYLGEEAVLSEFRVGDYSALRAELISNTPEILINCIGRTGSPNVDWCEDHTDETLFVNVTIPLLIARVCNELGIYWVHIGSGCIYEGDNGGKGFSEDDTPNFSGSFYSRTKAWSEACLKEFDNILQLRLRIPVDDRPLSKNLINKLLKYKKIAEVENSMTLVPDFLKAAKILMDKGKTGVYNVTNPGKITHVEILEMYKEIVDPDFTYETMTLEELEAVTKARRSNCVLNTDKLRGEGIEMKPIGEAVRGCLEKFKSQNE